MTTLAVISAQINFVIKYQQNEELLLPSIIAILLLICLGSFFLFFKAANEKFKTFIFSDYELSVAINTWHQVHWARTIVALIAFGLCICSL
jgi:hypothetical protein